MHSQRPFSRPAAVRTSSVASQLLVCAMARALVVVLATLCGPTAARAGAVVSVETTGVTSGAIFSVTATGLDATAAQNEITFTPSAGAPVVVPAASSAVVDATKGIRRVSVRVPVGIAVGPAGRGHSQPSERRDDRRGHDPDPRVVGARPRARHHRAHRTRRAPARQRRGPLRGGPDARDVRGAGACRLGLGRFVDRVGGHDRHRGDGGRRPARDLGHGAASEPRARQWVLG